MASNSRMTQNRRRIKKGNLGRKRKNQMARKSTLSKVELFAGMGDPGKPAPKSASH
jgi:hypothetical protein